MVKADKKFRLQSAGIYSFLKLNPFQIVYKNLQDSSICFLSI